MINSFKQKYNNERIRDEFMKNRIVFILLAVTLILSSCSAGSNTVTTEAETKSETTAAETAPPETKKPKSFLKTAANIKSESYSADYTYDYNENGKLVKETGNEVIDSVISSYVCTYTYNDDNSISSHKKTERNGVTTKTDTVTTYNDKELPTQISVSETLNDTTVETVTKFEYNEKGKPIRVSQSIMGNESVIEYEYTDEYGSNIMKSSNGMTVEQTCDQNGNIIKSVTKTQNGDIMSTTESQYDENNKLIKMTYNGVITEFEYTYENGLLVTENKKINGKTGSCISYEYDKYGNIIKIITADELGNITNTEEYTWTPVY